MPLKLNVIVKHAPKGDGIAIPVVPDHVVFLEHRKVFVDQCDNDAVPGLLVDVFRTDTAFSSDDSGCEFGDGLPVVVLKEGQQMTACRVRKQ